MLSTRVLVGLVLLIALCCASIAHASTARPQRRHSTLAAAAAASALPRNQRPVHSADVRAAQASRKQQQPATDYSAVMAYHEEPTRPPKPLYEAQWDVEDFHTGGGYDLEMSDVLNNAGIYAGSATPANNSVWVFDVDETSLSGYTEMLSIGFGYVAKMNHDWILSASAPALPQTQALYKQLILAGFRVIFLTGRKDIESDATRANLISVGYTTFDTLITRVPAEYNLTATAYKSARRTQLVEQEGYNVVGCVGDQWSDLHGPYTGFKVKLPNYIYYLP